MIIIYFYNDITNVMETAFTVSSLLFFLNDVSLTKNMFKRLREFMRLISEWINKNKFSAGEKKKFKNNSSQDWSCLKNPWIKTLKRCLSIGFSISEK